MNDSSRSRLLPDLRDRALAMNPEQAWIIDNLAFLHIGGSTLYGTHTASSDLDIRGITIAPRSYWVGARSFEQWECSLPEQKIEVVITDVRKWLRLAVAVNPNVVETLFVDDDSSCALMSTDAWRSIRPRARALLNQRAHSGYHGYTTSQLKKMVIKNWNKTGRTAITEALGFDLKFAAHGFRLARQGAELLRTGGIVFPRPDREQLLAIREGRVYGPGDLDRCVLDLSAATLELDQAQKQSVLPAKADFQCYNQLLMDIFDRYVTADPADMPSPEMTDQLPRLI